MTSTALDVGAAGDFEPGVLKRVEAGGRALVVVRDGERVFALRDICSHRGARLSDGVLTGTALPCKPGEEIRYGRQGRDRPLPLARLGVRPRHRPLPHRPRQGARALLPGVPAGRPRLRGSLAVARLSRHTNEARTNCVLSRPCQVRKAPEPAVPGCAASEAKPAHAFSAPSINPLKNSLCAAAKARIPGVTTSA